MPKMTARLEQDERSFCLPVAAVVCKLEFAFPVYAFPSVGFLRVFEDKNIPFGKKKAVLWTDVSFFVIFAQI
ncbi:hypothetical protein NW212_09325 [Bacteroides sp. ET225]|nr:hypothetical protein [Bacteroides sp. ET225]